MRQPPRSQSRRPATLHPNWASPHARGLTAWWPLQTPSAIDAVRRLQAVNTSVQWGAYSDVGMAPTFDATNRLQVAHTSVLSPVNKTVAVWCLPLDSGAFFRTLVKKNLDYLLRLASGPYLQWVVWTGGTARILQVSASAVAFGTLQHFVGTWDGTTQVLYLNGVQVASQVPGGVTSSGSTDLAIGNINSGTNEGYVGGIADVRLHDRALSASDVRALYDPRTRWDLYRRPTRRVWRPTPATARVWAYAD